MSRVANDLPGADVVGSGIEDLERGKFTIAALLVAVGAPRLRAAGLTVPETSGWPDEPEHALYDALVRSGAADPHARYNSLIRRLVSFERALERQTARIPPEAS